MSKKICHTRWFSCSCDQTTQFFSTTMSELNRQLIYWTYYINSVQYTLISHTQIQRLAAFWTLFT